jgi:hypothetical protein
MNTIKLYLAESGRIANLKKDFPLYQGQFQNKLLNVYVPTSILAPNFTIQETGNTIADYVSSTAVKIGMTYTAQNGTIKVSKNYYMRFLKTLNYQGIEYALYERKLPQEFTFYAGQGVNSPILIANVVNILNDGTTPQVISITTSQTCSLEVMPSTYLDKDEVVEPSELEDLYAQLNSINKILPTKQDKEDNGLLTDNKTIVGAINENKGKIDTNTINISKNQENISKTQEEIASIKENFASAENYIGQLKGNSLPSNEQLSQFVRANTLPSREPKNGDIIIFVLEIANATDKNYKYIYSINGWSGYEIQPLESASNGTLGIIKGTYGIGLNNDILIDIVGGEILNIYIKDKMGNYRNLVEYLHTTETGIADIVDGTTIVGEAMKSLEDGLGNNIVNTYLTKTLGATKDFVKDYALPRAFNDIYFVSSSGFVKKVPTTPVSGVQFQVISSFVGDIRLFQIEQEISADFELSYKNGYSNNIYIATNQDEKFTFRLLTEYKKQGQDWEYLNVELSNPISFTSNTIEKVTFGGNFLSLADNVISLTNGDKIRQTLEVIKTTSGSATFDIYSNDIYPSTFNLTTQSYVLSGGGSGANVEIDSELSLESTNPVQNKVVTEALDKKLEEKDLTNYVKNTDYAIVGGKGGIIKLKPNGQTGFILDSDNNLVVASLSPDIISLRNNFIPLTSKDIDVAVKYAVTGYKKQWNYQTSSFVASYGNQIALTDEEKTYAQNWLGIGVWKHELDISEEVWQNEDGDYIITTSVKLIVLTSGDVELNKDNLKTYIDKGLVAVKNPYYNDPNAPHTMLNLSDNSLWWSGTNSIHFNCYVINNASGNSTLQELACSININNAIITDTKTQL